MFIKRVTFIEAVKIILRDNTKCAVPISGISFKQIDLHTMVGRDGMIEYPAFRDFSDAELFTQTLAYRFSNVDTIEWVVLPKYTFRGQIAYHLRRGDITPWGVYEDWLVYRRVLIKDEQANDLDEERPIRKKLGDYKHIDPRRLVASQTARYGGNTYEHP